MKILAIDPAEKTGWAISNQIYGVWNFKLRRDENFGSKLLRFRAKLAETCNSEKIELIAFERPSGIMPAALMSHSKFVAIIETYCEENNISCRGYSASEIKKFATGKGNAKKKLMIVNAKAKLKYKGNEDNEADALWILNLAKDDYNVS